MNPRTRIVAIVVVVVIVIAGIGAAYYVAHSSANSCQLKSTNPIVADQPETPDSMDPAVTFSTPGWSAVQQVYQGLVMYNGSSYTNFTGVLAKNWTTSGDGFHWNFTLQPNIHFSNGDPVNAYVMWYSLYRGIVMNQGPSFILGQNFNVPSGNISNTTFLSYLNTWNFFSPSASEVAIMSAPNQSFVALSPSVIQLNLGFGYLGEVPYHYLLSTLASPIATAQDPAYIQKNGGVQVSQVNGFMSVNMMGTGQYTLPTPFDPTGVSFTEVPSSNYWATSLAAQEPWNTEIQPAKSSIETNLQEEPTLVTQDLKDGAVGLGSFTYIGPSTLSQLEGISCLTVRAMPTVYGATAGSWWIYMNQSQAPFNNLSVREAVVHAIDYPEIISAAFGGDATQWVGPVPPSYPYYDPQNLSPYQYNPTLAAQEMKNSPWPNGFSGTLQYEYVNLGAWEDVASILQQNLAKIGIKIDPIGITLDQLYVDQTIDPATGQCIAQEASKGGPFPIGQEFYTSDYISPDDWTQNDAISYGSANVCMAGYDNSTVDNLTIEGAGASGNANLTSIYSSITSAMYYNYTDAWLVVPTSYQVYNNQISGIVSNPMGSALPYVMLYNTESAS